eukprot:m.53761 g.53761  ORF g.53761 m.53761 type:complete len:56 (-) comp11848_c1_seq1:37-204(-)
MEEKRLKDEELARELEAIRVRKEQEQREEEALKQSILIESQARLQALDFGGFTWG